jgi:hypothetical protein
MLTNTKGWLVWDLNERLGYYWRVAKAREGKWEDYTGNRSHDCVVGNVR